MKFSSSLIVGFIGLSATVFASPILEKKQATPVSVITGALNTLNATLTTYEAAISSAAVAAKNDLSATVAVAAAINANLAGIADAVKNATATIVAATFGAAGGIIGAVTGLVAQDIALLQADLVLLEAIVRGITATVTIMVTNLTPAALALVSAEAIYVLGLLQPLVLPIQAFAIAVSQAQASASLVITGIQNALTGISTIIGGLLRAIFPF